MTDHDVPPEAQDQIRLAVDTALSSPTQAQGFLSNIPNIDVGGARVKVVDGIDTALGAINTLMKYAWLIPDKYEAPLMKLSDALTKVKGWVG